MTSKEEMLIEIIKYIGDRTDEWAKIQSIEFAKWVNHNWLYQDTDLLWHRSESPEFKPLTSDQCYQLFIDSKK